MNEYLIYFYPIKPNAQLCIWQLDALNVDKPVSKYYQGEVQYWYDAYKVAKERSSHRDNNGMFAYNNSWWKVVKAETPFEAIGLFKEALMAHTTRQESILDKIKAEIENDWQLKKYPSSPFSCGLRRAMEIIEKHKEGSEK